MRSVLRWLKLAFYFMTFCFLVGAASAEAYKRYGVVGLMELAGVPVPVREKRVEVVKEVEVERARMTFEDALAQRLQRSKISKWLVGCILDRESTGRTRMSLTRFEQSYIDRGLVQGITKNKDEQRLWASSWCPFQIMGTWAKKYELDWSELLEPETCVHVGISILEQCWHDARGKGREKVYNTGICYNGSTGQAYAQALVECVSSEAIDKILQGEG